MSKITIRHQYYGGRGQCYNIAVDGEDMPALSQGWPKEALLIALVLKYKDMEEAPAAVVSALRRYKARWGKDINPKLPHAPLPYELIQVSWWTEETGWDFVVVNITAKHPDGSCWQRTLRSPHYSKKEWETVRYFMLKQRISEAELSRLRQIACKERGRFEIKMVPYDYGGWRGLSR